MLRVLIFILLPLFATGCLEEEESDDIVNDQGDSVSDPTLRLNGLWNHIVRTFLGIGVNVNLQALTLLKNISGV